MNPEVAVLVANGSEELEAITIVDLLRRANIGVTIVSIHQLAITCARKTKILADTLIDDIKEKHYNAIILPGGLPGADHLRDDPRVIQLLQKHYHAKQLVGAICAAPKVLEKAGLLDNKTATAYPGTLEAINNPAITISQGRVALAENVITSRGPGTAIDFALKIIEQLTSQEVAEQVKAGLT